MFFLAGLLLVLSQRAFPWGSAFFDTFRMSFSARAAALGGTHAALADDISTLFSNPAGFRSVEPQFSVAESTVSFYGSAAELLGGMLSGGGTGVMGEKHAALNVLGPLALGYVGNGVGFGIFSSSNVRLNIGDASTPDREIVEGNLFLIGGYAFRIPLPEGWHSSLDIGLSLAAFLSIRNFSFVRSPQFLQYLAPPFQLTQLATIIGPVQRAVGSAVEFGLLYSFKNILSFGISGRDLSLEQLRTFDSFAGLLGAGVSKPSLNILPLDLSAGILFRPPLGRLGRYISDLKFMVDYQDIFDFLIYPPGATHPLLHIGAGLEANFLEIVSVRVGLYQCLVSFGLGLDLTYFTLNFAYFGQELSGEPGGEPVSGYAVGLEFKY